MADALTDAIIGAVIEVHRILGPGLLESVYELRYVMNSTCAELHTSVRWQSM